jgi:peptide/nickel transport system substrate-binding protein
MLGPADDVGGQMTNSGGRYDRRTFLARGASASAGLVLISMGAPVLCASCGGAHASTVHSVTPGVTNATPRPGGSITVGVNSEIDGFLPSQNHFDNTGTLYADTVFDTLTKLGADGEIHPYLATSVVPNTDMTAWTVTLRPGVVFHDGTPLNADVLVANVGALKQGLLTGLALEPIAGATKVDEFTVQYNCAQPLVPFPAYLTTQVGYVVALSQLDDPQGTKRPVGTGPFQYVTWEPNDRFTVERNPHYWRSGLPYLDGITYRPIVSDSAREASLTSGEIDLMVSRDPQIIADLQSNNSYRQVTDIHSTAGQPDMDYIILNTSVDPLNDLTVRQALAHATDVEQLVRLFDRSVVPPNTSLFPPGSPYRPADNGYPAYDLAMAKKLVAEAAPRHGGTLKLSLGTIAEPRLIQATQALQSMWGLAGFDVSLTETEAAELISDLAVGNFQAYTDEGFSAPDPDINYVWVSPTTAGSPGGIALNFARNRDAAMEAALQRGRTSSDRATRIAAYQEVDRLLAHDLPYLWIAQAPWSATGTSRVMDFANPVLPDGTKGQGFSSGNFTPTQIWMTD